MEPIFLKHLSNNEPLNDSADVNSPFSYLEWKGQLPFLNEKDATERYNDYITNWFQKNKQKPISQKFVLRQKYLYMLDKLQLFFDKDEKNNWYKEINLADEKELLLAIPYFAKKLKDISLYYLNLRKKLKQTKVKYNQVGSILGIEKEIYSYLLETFSLKNNELAPSVQTTVPSLSVFKNSLSVQIEELYDDKQYFDLSPTQPLTSYFNLLDEATSSFLSTKGISLTSANWLFNSFDIPVGVDNFETIFSKLTGTLFETTDTENYRNFVEKYIAEKKYVVEFLPQLTSINTFNLLIDEGNNQFYYPYGKTNTTYSINQQLPPIALSSLKLSDATAGNGLQDSDTIIVTYGNTTKAAWLKNVEYEFIPKTVKAIIKKDTTTRFIYPFPGYGLSGSDLSWTGSSFETNKEYNFLSLELKAAVNDAYWSQELPTDSINSVLLNNTSLVSSGGPTPNTDPRFADHFYIRRDRNVDNTMPYGEVDGAWFYKFTRTALPVSTNEDNVFLWPYTRLSVFEGYPDYLNQLNFAKACNPVSVGELNKAYFTAGNGITTADKIYKLNKYDDPVERALECAWLSGSTLSLTNYASNIQTGINALNAGGVNGYKFVNQDGFSALFEAGEYTRFIWTGPSQTDLDDVFSSPQHRKDCPFVTNNPSVSAFDWQNCTCKQVYHAPFGHFFRTLEEGNYLADLIIQVPDEDLVDFDFGTWRDSKNLPALSSLEVAWYRTRNSKANFTWGGGSWVSNRILGSNPFTLYKGKTYIYRRANVKNQQESLPPYSVKYNYYTDQTKWLAAKFDGTSWAAASGNPISNLTFYPGDIMRIDKQGTTTHYLLSATYVENVSVNKNHIWSSYDVIPILCGTSNSSVIRWPIDPPPWGSEDPQYPITTFAELSYIACWSIKHEETREIHYAPLQELVTFVPPMEGTYTIAVTAVMRDGSFICIPPEPGLGVTVYDLSSVTFAQEASSVGLQFANANDYYYGEGVSYIVNRVQYGSTVTFTFNKGPKTIFSNKEANTIIPKISAVGQFQKTKLIEIPFQTPTSGFLIEQPLRGWNYSTNRVDPRASGARPYWATLDTQKTSATRYKGIYSWGYPDDFIDGYLPNSNPVLSPLQLNYGSIVEYSRRGYPFVWEQLITYQQRVDTQQWCALSGNLTQASVLSSFYRIKENIDPIVIPTNNPSDIILSNTVEGAPLQISYYALNSFAWPIDFITVEKAPTPGLSAYFDSKEPWLNLTNRFNPTIANIPVLDETYSVKDVGGYFLPQRLGASQFVNKDYDIFYKDGVLSGTYLAENIIAHIGGRGRTKEDQNTIYDWSENNQWLKESVTTGNLAGSTKKSLTKNLQTFVPYQSNIDETALGLVTTRSKFSPWGGPNGDTWLDKNNEPVGFTGVRNVSAWAASQVLKQNEKSIDSWASDIYGNQYGLFKELDGIALSQHPNVFGELWVRTNNQNVIPATAALSAVFSPFQGLTGVDAYKEMIENKIQIFDCYFDNLFIKTPSLALFAKITYNYDYKQIEMVFDDARWKELNDNFIFNKNWFIPSEKKLYSLYTKVENRLFYPYLYELNLATREVKCVFDSYKDNKYGPAPIHFTFLENASLYYNSLLNTFLITYAGRDIEDKLFVADYYIKNERPVVLTKIDLYKDFYAPEATNEPPLTVSNYLSVIDVGLEPFTVAVSAINNPTSFELINYKNEISVATLTSVGVGVFTGQISSVGLHHVNYKVSNNLGYSLFSLTLSVANRNPVYMLINITSETGTEVANSNNGTISITCTRNQGLSSAIQVVGQNLTSPQNYEVLSGETITIQNLESGIYEIRVIDTNNIRTVRLVVGFTGLAGLFLTIPSSIEGHSLNTIFEL